MAQRVKLTFRSMSGLFLAVGVLLSSGRATAQSVLGTAVTYQGRLTDAGSPANGPYHFQFFLYDAAMGGIQVGSPITQLNIPVTDGLFTVQLDFGASPWTSNQAVWLQVEVASSGGPFTSLSPRQPLTAAPYALGLRIPFAATAAHNGAAFDAANSSVDGIGLLGAHTATTGTAPGVHGRTDSTSASAVGVLGESISSNGVGVEGRGVTGVFGSNTASSNAAAVWGQNGIGFGPPTTSCGVLGTSTLGHGIAAYSYSGQAAIWAFANSAGGEGVYGRADGNGMSGIYGNHLVGNGGYGVTGWSAGSSGTGVRGKHAATTGTAPGVLGETDSTSSGALGVVGVVTATGAGASSCGVRGDNNSTSSLGVGVYGYHAGSGIGVYGEANNVVAGYAGYFNGRIFATTQTTEPTVYAETLTGIGVYGISTSVGGVHTGVYGDTNGLNGRGVYGNASSSSAGAVPYGVRGFCNTATLGYAVYANGDMGASGVKSFRIDHPFDPLNKYLLHYAAEGPVPQNIYNGITATDANGYAWIELPDYFEEINKDFRYSLTALDDSDDFVLAKVTQRISGNRFQIRTSKANIDVSWEIKGTRNDVYCKLKQPKDVMDKVGAEKDKYQQPELYGMPKEMGMDFNSANVTQGGHKTGRQK